jgi:magnesium chelatase family protein
MDRIDIDMEVPSVPYKDLSGGTYGTSSAEMMERVMDARQIQSVRFRGTSLHTNADMATRHIKRYCTVDDASSALLEKAMTRFGLSARAHSRILKIARTIADLERSDLIQPHHVAEAIQYRTLDRKS